MVVKLSAIRDGRPLPPERFLVLTLLEAESIPKAIVRLEGLGQLKNPVNRTYELPACSTVPQPITLPRARWY
jgi:hypothetical protein